MDNDVDEVNDDPPALLETVAAQDRETLLAAESLDFVADRADLLLTGAGADDEVLGDGTAVDQFKDNHISAMTIVGQQRHRSREIATGLQVAVIGV